MAKARSGKNEIGGQDECNSMASVASNRFVRKKIWLALTSSVITLMVAWMAVEIYLRQYDAPTTSGLVPILYTHKGVQISSIPSYYRMTLAPFTVIRNLPSPRGDYFINSRGLRAEEGAERAEGPKVLLLGGSAAFGLTVRSNADTIAYLLENRVSPYKVLNAGVGSFLSGQELSYLATEGIDYHPAVVIAYDGWNDLFDSTYRPRPKEELGINHNFFELEDQLAANYQSLNSSRISFSRFIGATYPKSRVVSRFVNHFYPKQPLRLAANPAMMALALDVYTNNLRKMDRISRAFDAHFVVVFQPELGQKIHHAGTEQLAFDSGIIGADNYAREFPDLYKQFINLAKERLTKDGIQWIDTNEDARIRDAPDQLFQDVVHTNRQGNEVVAAIIGEWLLRPADLNGVH